MSRVGVRKACAPFLLSGLLACAAPKGPAQGPPAESPAARFARDPAAVERGRLILVGTCGAYCHSTHNVERDAPSLFDCEWKHGGSDAEIFHSISAGVPGTRMPAWAGALPQGDDDIWRVIAYLRSASTCKRSSIGPTSTVEHPHSVRQWERPSGPARGFDATARIWSARRKASATIVSMGAAVPAVGKTELPAT